MSKSTNPVPNLQDQTQQSHQRIEALHTHVIDQIAAGEVLERPAHMVKELIENSLDAGATHIEVHIKNGGRDVKIKDNGRGILAEDLDIALIRHTTSKLSEMKDLWSLHTFGFRGEALASVAAVSHLTLRSRQKEGVAYEIQSVFGKIQDKVESQHEVGTTIEIQGLFDNVPARKKFLKTDAYEVSEIRKVVSAYGLSSSKTEIKFFYNDKLESLWPGQADIMDRYKEILKTQDLYSKSKDFGDVKVDVFFAPPHETAKSTRRIWLFVQNRWVQEPSLLAAVRDGFQNALLPGESPIGVVFVNMAPDIIDVNVHPTKSRVKFQDPASVYRAVRNTLLDLVEQSPWRQDFLMADPDALGTSPSVLSAPLSSVHHRYNKTAHRPNNYAPVDDAPSVHSKIAQHQQTDFDLKAYRSAPSQGDEAKDLSHKSFQVPEGVTGAAKFEVFGTEDAQASASADTPQQSSVQSGPRWAHLKVIGQVAKTYIVTQNQTEMILIDQHASHERFLFEKLWTAFRNGRSLETQNHLIPLTYALEEDGFMDFLLAEKQSLEKLGIIFEQSGPSQIEIVATPVLFKDKSIVKSLDMMLEQMAKNSSSFVFEDVVADLFATMACHSAIRAGQILSIQEMESLLDCMDEFPTTSYCPHGRPVFVRYPFSKLETDFFRRV